jgi:hypothetical protein
LSEKPSFFKNTCANFFSEKYHPTREDFGAGIVIEKKQGLVVINPELLTAPKTVATKRLNQHYWKNQVILPLNLL